MHARHLKKYLSVPVFMNCRERPYKINNKAGHTLIEFQPELAPPHHPHKPSTWFVWIEAWRNLTVNLTRFSLPKFNMQYKYQKLIKKANSCTSLQQLFTVHKIIRECQPPLPDLQCIQSLKPKYNAMYFGCTICANSELITVCDHFI